MTLKGVAHASGKVFIEGNMEGELHANNVVIGKSGQINGTLVADDIDVYGSALKDITATQNLIVHSQAIVSGKVFYRDLQVVKGGVLNAEIHKL